MVEIAFENGRISNFQGLVTFTFDRVILHTIVHHSSTSTYKPNFIEIEETFCGRTDVCTHGWTDRHSRPTLLGRLLTQKSQPRKTHPLIANWKRGLLIGPLILRGDGVWLDGVSRNPSLIGHDAFFIHWLALRQHREQTQFELCTAYLPITWLPSYSRLSDMIASMSRMWDTALTDQWVTSISSSESCDWFTTFVVGSRIQHSTCTFHRQHGSGLDGYLLSTSKSHDTKTRTKINNPAPLRFRYGALI